MRKLIFAAIGVLSALMPLATPKQNRPIKYREIVKRFNGQQQGWYITVAVSPPWADLSHFVCTHPQGVESCDVDVSVYALKPAGIQADLNIYTPGAVHSYVVSANQTSFHVVDTMPVSPDCYQNQDCPSEVKAWALIDDPGTFDIEAITPQETVYHSTAGHAPPCDLLGD